MENMYVSSQVLEELQVELKTLAQKLQECYEQVSSDINTVAQGWRDEKFEEFKNAFEPYHEKITEMATRYTDWADKHLPPRIEKAKEYEKSNMGGTVSSGSGSMGSTPSSESTPGWLSAARNGRR